MLWHLGNGLDDHIAGHGEGLGIERAHAVGLADIQCLTETIGLLLVRELGHDIVDVGPLSLTGHHDVVTLKGELWGGDIISHLC